jgi:hypothetical protein
MEGWSFAEAWKLSLDRLPQGLPVLWWTAIDVCRPLWREAYRGGSAELVSVAVVQDRVVREITCDPAGAL